MCRKDSRAPQWEQQLLAWTSGDTENERAHEIEWYRELARVSEDPLVPCSWRFSKPRRVYVARRSSPRRSGPGRRPLPQFADLVMAAYGEGPSMMPSVYHASRGGGGVAGRVVL